MIYWIDFFVILIIVIYILEGYRQGFIKQIIDLIGLVAAFLIALRYYDLVAIFFVEKGVNSTLSKPLGFFALWAILQLIFYIIMLLLFRLIPDFINTNKINKYLGTSAGLLKGIAIVSLFLILLMTMPIKGTTKDQLSNSLLAGRLIKSTATIETSLNKMFGPSGVNASFLGLLSQNGETVKLGFQTSEGKIDEGDEIEMLVSINEERKKAGLPFLKQDLLLRNIARAHARDMLIKGYFSHVDLTGKSPSDRFMDAGVTFKLAGENLALAPSVELAEIGLMNSLKHRENILSPEYSRVGIGVLDAGTFGKMFVQEFAD